MFYYLHLNLELEVVGVKVMHADVAVFTTT